jgi:hypothetical protein
MPDFNLRPDLHLDLWPELQPKPPTPKSPAKPVTPVTKVAQQQKTRSGSGLSVHDSVYVPPESPILDEAALRAMPLSELRRIAEAAQKEKENE